MWKISNFVVALYICLVPYVGSALLPTPSPFPANNFTIDLLVGNQIYSTIDVYRIYFTCNGIRKHCETLPVRPKDLLWRSNKISGLSEVKYTKYGGKSAILATTTNGAIVLEFPSGKQLFHKEIGGYVTNVHSAEVMPDGNVIIVDSKGPIIILRNDSKVEKQPWKDSVWYLLYKPHGIYYDRKREVLYVLEYSALYAYKYTETKNKKGNLALLHFTNLTLDYYPVDNEKNYQGGHDLYPIDGSKDLLYVTTGEHVYKYDMASYTLAKDPLLYTLASRHGNVSNVPVRNKGGVKAISKDPNSPVTFLHPAPWFKIYEIGNRDTNYQYSSNILLWSFPGTDCEKPDIDLTAKCKIDFSAVIVRFYKARVFSIPELSG